MRIPALEYLKNLISSKASTTSTHSTSQEAQAVPDQTLLREQFLNSPTEPSQAQTLLEQKDNASIGRSSTNDVQYRDDPKVSRQHLQLTFKSPYIKLEDLKSTKGTYVRFFPKQNETIEATNFSGHVIGLKKIEIQDKEAKVHSFKFSDLQDQLQNFENAFAGTPIGAKLTITFNPENSRLGLVRDGEKVPDGEAAVFEVKKQLSTDLLPKDSPYSGTEISFRSVYNGNCSIELGFGRKNSEDGTLYATHAKTDAVDMDIKIGDTTIPLRLQDFRLNTEQAKIASKFSSTVDLLALLAKRKQ